MDRIRFRLNGCSIAAKATIGRQADRHICGGNNMFGLKFSPGTLTTLMAILLVIAKAPSVLAQNEAPATPATTAVASPDSQSQPSPPRVLTGKERLGQKWMDEQRIDNCRVPLDKRGAKPRPDECSDGSEPPLF
jgi:hypothetical protein